MDSDSDSDFYGDDETIADLRARVKRYDVTARWALNAQAQMPMRLQALRQSPPTPAEDTAPGPATVPTSTEPDAASNSSNSMDTTAAVTSTTRMHNPYAGVRYARQLDETIEAFLARLPPASTPATAALPWIYIYNPLRSARKPSQAGNRDRSQVVVRGAEDEAPVEQGADLRTFCEGGMERLHLATRFIEQCRGSGMARAFVARECRKAGADAAREVLDLAHALRVRCGKWMLFPSVKDVNKTWEIVARATANNELGIAAKVAPRPEDEDEDDHNGGGGDGKEDGADKRLICVYTTDFRDMEDVGRVARKLEQLGLVPRRGLFYKPGWADAYTYLGIASGNPWGIKPSIYDLASVLGKNS
ncbi:hypothetical protein DL766_006053 [Monosporascus sp. MC13-8B]|uniref:DUF1917-domain-containing protein n=1 Tax=Monosporascus cannonballus TaxID=155416 RepID=A0ABY0GUN4_9PEZI|nr:hypothetical protein DL762_009087 [Monosporascus cannonballus]RYO84920.1 hypothetical protein DL763_007290 [Monosporascus cannonballus]RYP28157.1 hypothetical protein DL766_006053 [Monosporascus sp. MC13-8B]